MKSEAQQFRIPATQQGENQRKRTHTQTRREREREKKNECKRWLEMALLCLETVVLCFFSFLRVLSAK